MELPPARFLMAHAVLQPAAMLPRSPASDEIFIAAVRSEFPNVISRQFVSPDLTPQAPHVTLASTSSQLALSALQADFEVQFYGEYLDDLPRGLDYVAKKLAAIVAGFDAMGAPPSMVGLIATLHFSLKDTDVNPVEHIVATHMRVTTDVAEVQDAQVKVALKVADKYFLNITLSNYELRTFMRPVMPNMGPIRMRPWEGNVDDYGLALTVDINNNLEAKLCRADPVVTTAGVSSVISLLRDVGETVGPAFAETGDLSADALTITAPS